MVEKKSKSFFSSDNPNWKGGKRIRQGYWWIRLPWHPKANNGYVREHRVLMELKIKRFLKDDEVVHHINHDKLDNRLENLHLCSQSEHKEIHRKDRLKVMKYFSDKGKGNIIDIDEAIKECYFKYKGNEYLIEKIPEGHDKYCEGTMCYCKSRARRKEKEKNEK